MEDGQLDDPALGRPSVTTLTLDELAGMLARGFETTYDRLNLIDRRLDRVEQHVERRLDDMGHRLRDFENQIADQHDDFLRLERDVAVTTARHESHIDAFARELAAFRARQRTGGRIVTSPFLEPGYRLYFGPHGAFLSAVPFPRHDHEVARGVFLL